MRRSHRVAPARRRARVALPLAAALAALAPPGCDGCVEEAPVRITAPPHGTMIPAGAELVAQVESDRTPVSVNGREQAGSGPWRVPLPAVDGLGVVVAEVDGDPLLATVSYHQGRYRPARADHPDTLRVSLGAGPLADPVNGVAGLVSRLLTAAELESFVDDPFPLTVTVIVPVTAQVYVESVSTPDAAVALTLDGAALRFHARLSDVDVDYRATATGLASSGTARYALIEVRGVVEPTLEGAVLTAVESTASDPVITDSGGLPPAAVESLARLLNDEVPAAVVAAADRAADEVLGRLLADLRPTVGLAFDHPIRQTTTPSAVRQDAQGIALRYDTRIEAAAAVVAAPDHGVLERPAPGEPEPGDGIACTAGSALVNAFAFAVWDAGNLRDLRFTREQLEDGGMGTLEFPYSNLESATLHLLLPPLLEWAPDGPRLEAGGIQVDLVVASAPDSTAWTAASVPVRLELAAGTLHLRPDPDRAVTLRPVGFDRMSSLVDRAKVLTLLQAAVPGVVERVFGDLPALAVAPFSLQRLDGSPGPTVTPRIESVTARSADWRVVVALAVE